MDGEIWTEIDYAAKINIQPVVSHDSSTIEYNNGGYGTVPVVQLPTDR